MKRPAARHAATSLPATNEQMAGRRSSSKFPKTGVNQTLQCSIAGCLSKCNRKHTEEAYQKLLASTVIKSRTIPINEDFEVPTDEDLIAAVEAYEKLHSTQNLMVILLAISRSLSKCDEDTDDCDKKPTVKEFHGSTVIKPNTLPINKDFEVPTDEDLIAAVEAYEKIHGSTVCTLTFALNIIQNHDDFEEPFAPVEAKEKIHGATDMACGTSSSKFPKAGVHQTLQCSISRSLSKCDEDTDDCDKTPRVEELHGSTVIKPNTLPINKDFEVPTDEDLIAAVEAYEKIHGSTVCRLTFADREPNIIHNHADFEEPFVLLEAKEKIHRSTGTFAT